MTKSRVTVFDRLCAWLLHALPRELRLRYEEEMREAYRELDSRSAGTLARLRVRCELFADLVWLLARAWLRELGRAAVGAWRRASGGRRASEALARDFVAALRLYARRPAVAALALGALGLGLGAAITVFCFADAILLEPFPYRAPDRLVVLFQDEGRDDGRQPVSPAAFDAWRRRGEGIESLVAARWFAPVLGTDHGARRLEGLLATPELFDLLGVPPLLGTTFDAAAVAGSAADERVVVLGHTLWQRELGGRADVVGDSILLDGEAYRVLGVMPRGFRFPPFWATGAELWAPLVLGPEDRDHTARFLRVFGRLEPHVSLEEVQASYRALGDSLAAARPEQHAGTTIRVEPLRAPVLVEIRPVLLGLLAAAGLLLVLVGANVAGLLACRGLERSGELAVRAALGASRRRLLGQFSIEAGVLCLTGGALGVGVAALAIPAATRLFASSLPVTADVSLDARSVVAGLLLSIGCVPALAVAASLGGSPHGIAATLRSGRSVGLPLRALRSMLVTVQVALAVALLAAAGLLVRTVQELLRHDPGFQTENVSSVELALSASPYRDRDKRPALLDPFLDQLRALPGLEAAGVVYHLPVGGDLWQVPFRAAEEPPPAPGDEARAALRVADDAYASAIGLRLLRGRWIEPSDRRDRPPVVVVNETLAEQTWPGQDPIGRRLQVADWQPVTVVGVYDDTDQAQLASTILPELHYPLLQEPISWNDQLTIVVRGSAEPVALAEEMRALLARIDPAAALHSARTLEQVHGDQIARQRASSWMLVTFGSSALLLCALGLFGLLAEFVARRRGEIGLRLALGAGRRRILRLVVLDALRVAAPGIAAGLAVSVLLGRALESQLFGVRPIDAPTLAAIAVLALGTVLVAVAVPAGRAARVDPARSLRAE